MAEFLSILRLLDHFERSTDHLHAVALKHTAFRNGYCSVQSCLSSQGGENGIGPFLGDDLCYSLRRNRLHVGSVRRFGISHYRRGIAVDQNDLIPFFLQCLAGLRSGVVEFACLADNDRPGTDDQNF